MSVNERVLKPEGSTLGIGFRLVEGPHIVQGQIHSTGSTASLLLLELASQPGRQIGKSPQPCRPVHAIPVKGASVSLDFDVANNVHWGMLIKPCSVMGSEVPASGF